VGSPLLFPMPKLAPREIIDRIRAEVSSKAPAPPPDWMFQYPGKNKVSLPSIASYDTTSGWKRVKPLFQQALVRAVDAIISKIPSGHLGGVRFPSSGLAQRYGCSYRTVITLARVRLRLAGRNNPLMRGGAHPHKPSIVKRIRTAFHMARKGSGKITGLRFVDRLALPKERGGEGIVIGGPTLTNEIIRLNAEHGLTGTRRVRIKEPNFAMIPLSAHLERARQLNPAATTLRKVFKKKTPMPYRRFP